MKDQEGHLGYWWWCRWVERTVWCEDNNNNNYVEHRCETWKSENKVQPMYIRVRMFLRLPGKIVSSWRLRTCGMSRMYRQISTSPLLHTPGIKYRVIYLVRSTRFLRLTAHRLKESEPKIIGILKDWSHWSCPIQHIRFKTYSLHLL